MADTYSPIQLLDSVLANKNLTAEQERDLKRERRRQERKENKRRREKEAERRERRRKHKEKKAQQITSALRNTPKGGRRLRSKDLFFDLSQRIAMEEKSQNSSQADNSLLGGQEADTTDGPTETFKCVCTDCPDSNTCISDFYCTAISYKEEAGHHTVYGCLNRDQAIFELAYCKGGDPGNTDKDTLRTICCKGDMCNDVPPPKLPTTTTTESSTAAGSGNNMPLLNTKLYLMVPTALMVLLLILIAILVYKQFKTSKKKRKEKERIKSYLVGDNLSAQPLTDDCSIELPDPTSGSGSGMPMLVQRTVAKSVALVEQIGTGKYGNVYKGVYHGSFVAVKIFLSKDIDSWTRENDIYTTLLLRHDNILGFMASDMISCDSVTQFWLIFHYHEHGSLYDYLNQPYNVITPTQCLLMLYSAAAGLVHLHTEIFGTQAKPAIAHRDIKSKNILVKEDGSCCIADLGLAVTHKTQGDLLDLGNNNKVGTKRYMAPEVLADALNYNDFESYKRADIYAFSLVMWETVQCTIKDGHAEKYLMPYGGLVQNDPTFEEMRSVVVGQKIRPPVPKDWSSDQIFKSMSKLIQECWCESPTARLTILRIKKTLGTLLDESRDYKVYV